MTVNCHRLGLRARERSPVAWLQQIAPGFQTGHEVPVGRGAQSYDGRSGRLALDRDRRLERPNTRVTRSLHRTCRAVQHDAANARVRMALRAAGGPQREAKRGEEDRSARDEPDRSHALILARVGASDCPEGQRRGGRVLCEALGNVHLKGAAGVRQTGLEITDDRAEKARGEKPWPERTGRILTDGRQLSQGGSGRRGHTAKLPADLLAHSLRLVGGGQPSRLGGIRGPEPGDGITGAAVPRSVRLEQSQDPLRCSPPPTPRRFAGQLRSGSAENPHADSPV